MGHFLKIKAVTISNLSQYPIFVVSSSLGHYSVPTEALARPAVEPVILDILRVDIVAVLAPQVPKFRAARHPTLGATHPGDWKGLVAVVALALRLQQGWSEKMVNI